MDKIKVKYEDKMYDAEVVGDHKVLIYDYEISLYQQEGDAKINIYLDQCLNCGVWSSEEDGYYGDGYCDGCAAICIECECYHNAVDMIPPIEDGAEYVCKECGKDFEFIVQLKDTTDEDLFWSNIDGWGDKASATSFVLAEYLNTYPLPLGGKWVIK